MRRVVLVVALAACHGNGGAMGGGDSASASAPASGSPLAPTPALASALPPEPAPTLPPAPSGEARRSTVPTLGADPLLRSHLAVLRDHFGAASPGPFLLQRVERAGGGSAVLVSRADESDPVVLAVDRDRLDFERNHPVGGITPPALHLAIAPGPEAGVALFSYVPAQHLVAARMWASDGNPFAEIVALDTEACDTLAVAYGVGWGWVLTCSSATGTRAQRLRENLTVAWGTQGAVVGAIGPVGRLAGPAIALLDASTWTLTQRARAVGGDRTITFRYDADAQPIR